MLSTKLIRVFIITLVCVLLSVYYITSFADLLRPSVETNKAILPLSRYILRSPSVETNNTIPRVRFLSYQSSPWEEEWIKNVVQYQNNPCGIINETTELALANEWVRQSPIRNNSMTFNTTVFSTYTFRDYEGKEFKTYIEPLAGLTRHPLTCVDFSRYVIDKNYIQISCELPQLTKEKGYKMYYFDLGASLWYSGGGGASQSWIYEQYKWCIKSSENTEPFDGLFMWEAQRQSLDNIWKDVPESVKPIYYYFNEPAATGTWGNPLDLLRKIVKREDFLVLKIDIDNTPVETEFIKQILDSSELLELIDDFFFEHHVNVEPLASCCWLTESAPEKLKDTFDIFIKFRKAGVRAHSWV